MERLKEAAALVDAFPRVLHNGKDMNGGTSGRDSLAVIASVAKGSIASRLGIRPGSRVVSVNGRAVRDVIDYRFYTAEEFVELEVEDADGRRRSLGIEKHPDEGLGLDFGEELFDGVKRCSNACPFCFVDGLPDGMRESLYLKDDDYRLSFLHGNFITMTNMKAEDFDRILEQRLSPLYVSVHSTDPDTRRRMLGVSRAGEVMRHLGLLVDGGIRIHAQVVVVPGMNDGPRLDSTIDDLAAMFPGIASVGVVPVGLTRFQRACGVRPLKRGELRGLVDWWSETQPALKGRLGYGFVFLADEAFLGIEAPFPGTDAYEDFPQYENGIGIGPSFLEELDGLSLPRAMNRRLAATLVCGELAAPLIRRAAAALNRVEGLRVAVSPVKNRFFGGTVTVSGLLTSGDIAASLRDIRAPSPGGAGDIVVVPSICLRDGVFLDGGGLDELSAILGRRAVAAGPGPADLLHTLVKEAGGR
ncbi:MAG: DUF512 domain-containing protein [Ignavibacteriales bacterium]